MIYLDSAATTFQKPNSVLNAVTYAMKHYASVGRGGYSAAAAASDAVFACREFAADMFDCEPEQVVFTMNATHGLNIAIRSLVKPGGRVVVSGFEHNAVLRPLHALGAEIFVAGRKLYDSQDTLMCFEKAVAKDVSAVICTHVSNVFGYILPVEEIGELCRKKGIPFIVDASQSAGILPVSLRKMNADFIAMPGHKSLYGPQGTGMLLCGRLPAPFICGGTGSMSANMEMPDILPDRAEAGTHNVPGICGLFAGLRFVQSVGTEKIRSHEQKLAAVMIKNLEKEKGIQLYRAGSESFSGVLSFSVQKKDCEKFAASLAKRDIAVRAGLHCAPLAHESAGTLHCGTVRVSFSAFSTLREVNRASEVIARICHEKNWDIS